jgi:hypothetical protein
MIKPFLWQHSNELFGGEAPPHIRALIDEARQGPRAELGERLWAIQAQAPACLPVYYLLYKLHAGRRELALAERAALAGLAQAGLQSGLPTDVTFTATPLVDFTSNGPARFWLFTLKAIAFIRMRRGCLTEARQVIEWIRRCDPQLSLGSDVVLQLLHGASD